GTSTGDMAGDYTMMSLAYKRDLSDRLSMGFYLNTPYGANALYTQGPYTGLTATWESEQIAAVLRYEVQAGLSVYGGARYVRSQAEIAIPDTVIRNGLAAAGLAGNVLAGNLAANAPLGSLAYTADGSRTGDVGYIAGAAYERPDIALRVALTYESEIEHGFRTRETLAAVEGLFGPFPVTQTNIRMPQTLTLDFQSGVAQDTLVFGSIRWAEWSVWEVRPAGFDSVFGDNVTDFENDVITYQLGVGRRINESLSVFVRGGYEDAKGGIASRLAPTDGQKSLGVGGTYTVGNAKITGGIEYVDIGGAVDGSGTRFRGNSALGFGLSVGYRF
ncbi:OmpP1/FadL family transporter, partial [Aphanothece microscopica]|uniref:OmpP1/FadL family transporter n=1 Tax=Aphanothece microscopica TaxID=1049561 RepID=UPI0039848048